MSIYGEYCPIKRAAEILGDRWTLLIVYQLLEGKHHFNELERALPGISRSLLAARLRRLQATGVVERRLSPGGRSHYELTTAGKHLQPVLDYLLQWGAKWGFGELEPRELDPGLLLWWMRHQICRDRLPPERVVVEILFADRRSEKYWLVLEREDVSLCLQHPGFEIDMHVTADLPTLYRVWKGQLTFNEAVERRRIEIESTPALTRAFPRWFAWEAPAGTSSPLPTH